jgi:(2Fe-2S) ferredoxin
MSAAERYILICVNVMPEDHPLGCCTARGSFEIVERFQEAARAAESDGAARIRVETSGCFGRCENGPVMVVYPEGIWYGGVRPEDVRRIVREHLVGGEPVEDLRLPDGEQPI